MNMKTESTNLDRPELTALLFTLFNLGSVSTHRQHLAVRGKSLCPSMLSIKDFL